MPTLVLEKIFAYLPWRDRAHAALACKRWLNAFCSANVWRVFTYHPPPQGLTRLQYDSKTYLLARAIRTIGWHFQYLRFPETEDFFMLNRVLSLIAEFLEAHPYPNSVSSDSVLSTEIISPDLAALEAAYSPSSSSGQHETSTSNDSPGNLSDAAVVEEIPLSILAEATSGDPELANSIALALRLQQEEYEKGLSSSLHSGSSSESGIEFACPSRPGCPPQLSSSVPIRFPMRSASTTTPPASRVVSRGRHYQRSVSCKFPSASSKLPRLPDTSCLPPPCIRSFSLDFHAEFDEASGVVYGSGGALFATIVRVLSRLRYLRALYLRNLFLSHLDTRQLLIEISAVAGSTLERASLLHVCKVTHERSHSVTSPSLSAASQTGSDFSINPTPTYNDTNRYWYLRDPRWLGSRPRILGWNPLADLSSLFPNLNRLEIALTQLTGPMLLRLIYQTRLSVLILTQSHQSNTKSGRCHKRPFQLLLSA
uniref:F-box domain-containing protein n=1 Tax=Mesocestoides corti TaxID=53468 RepID=A0A5K3FGK3_MESCO